MPFPGHDSGWPRSLHPNLQTLKLSTRQRKVAEFFYISARTAVPVVIFATDAETEGTSGCIELQHFYRRGNERNEDDKAGLSGDDNCDSAIHSDSEFVLGRR